MKRVLKKCLISILIVILLIETLIPINPVYAATVSALKNYGSATIEHGSR